MANRSVVAIVSAEKLDILNAIWEHAFNDGPGNFSIPLSSDGSQPPTHWGMHYGGATPENATMWQSMIDGVLAGGIDWGEGDIPSTGEAISACTPAHLTISNLAGDAMEPVAHFHSVLDGAGLQFAYPS